MLVGQISLPNSSEINAEQIHIVTIRTYVMYRSISFLYMTIYQTALTKEPYSIGNSNEIDNRTYY